MLCRRISELRAAIDTQGVAGYPAGLIRREESNRCSDVVGCSHPLERLDAQREISSRFCLGEVRHVGRYHTARNGIDANATFAQGGGEMLDQGIDGSLGSRIGRQRANRGARGERRQQHDTATVAHNRQQLLHEKVWSTHVHREQSIEILNGGFFDCAGRRNARMTSRSLAIPSVTLGSQWSIVPVKRMLKTSGALSAFPKRR